MTPSAPRTLRRLPVLGLALLAIGAGACSGGETITATSSLPPSSAAPASTPGTGGGDAEAAPSGSIDDRSGTDTTRRSPGTSSTTTASTPGTTDPEGSTTTTKKTTTTSSGTGASSTVTTGTTVPGTAAEAAWCGEFKAGIERISALEEQPNSDSQMMGAITELFRALTASAPAEIKADWQILTDAISNADPSNPPPDDVIDGPTNRIEAWTVAHCGFSPEDID